MNKVFEDYFSELQADMVSICLEYVDEKADKIFIYCSCEENVVSSNYFYQINQKIVKKHKLNEVLSKEEIDKGFSYNTSVEKQKIVIGILNDDIKKMLSLCKEYNREMPTEIKLIYNVKENKLKADYRYALVRFKDDFKTIYDITNEWFEDIDSKSKTNS